MLNEVNAVLCGDSDSAGYDSSFLFLYCAASFCIVCYCCNLEVDLYFQFIFLMLMLLVKSWMLFYDFTGSVPLTTAAVSSAEVRTTAIRTSTTSDGPYCVHFAL